MTMEVVNQLLLPFSGTVIGAAGVFFMKGSMPRSFERLLTGFAAGVMVAASVWSLLIPSMEEAAHMGKFAFLPAVIGLWLGFLFLMALDRLVPHLHMHCDEAEGPQCALQRSTMMVLAVALHNLPEGMAVGAVLASLFRGESAVSSAGAFALSLGLAIQNFPEGAIISMPLHSGGMKQGKAFLCGVLSGLVEPAGALITLVAAGVLLPTLPYLLSFVAGAMLYVVVEELIPEMSEGEHSHIGTIAFAVGFSLMIVLDVVLG